MKESLILFNTLIKWFFFCNLIKMAADITLTFLGTSDAIPSASRNHPAMLLTYQGENILVDCGEGTQRQFRKAKLNPCKVTRILISHWHNDHVLGLPGLLSTLSLTGYNKVLHIYGPKGTKKFIQEMLRAFAFQKNYEIKVEEVSGKFFEGEDFYLEAKEMTHGIPSNAYSFVKGGKLRIDKKKLKKSKLPLGPLLQNLKKGKDITYEGKKFKAKDLTYKEEERKVSFVMDTSYNDKIASFVKGAELLVSESSFTSKDADKAKEHNHLTAQQAGKIAKKGKVGRLILTHMGSRYNKNFKEVIEDAQKEFKECSAARDLDVITL